MTVMARCTAACTATPACAVCGRSKRLRGRSYPMAMGGGCDFECPGYALEPHAGHVWLSEWADHMAGDHRACMDCGGLPVAKTCDGGCGRPAYDCGCS